MFCSLQLPDRNTLWNAAEAIEKQWNSQLARRIVLAIPREIPPEQHADLLDESGTFGTKRKEILDSVSATVILDDYLAWRKEHPGEI